MSSLRIETWKMPAAETGPDNPLPSFGTPDEAFGKQKSTGLFDEMQKRFNQGKVQNILPYARQDLFTRDRQTRGFRAAVLENEFLKAVFLLELGGRLWSLRHKASGRELLEVNPVFQPSDLSPRGAWFTGGVEWNIGVIGHCVFTRDSLFAARASTPDGTPVLRMYEWERIRQIPFQIDAYLPDGSPVLFVRVRIVNRYDREVPMYWWTNIAVPETPATRVIAPADSAYRFTYGWAGIEEIPVGVSDGDEADFTYSTRINHAADFFFNIPDTKRRWIAALDREGKGLVQASTDLLLGRKMFLWGWGSGGKNWQEYLADEGRAYIELQAGLCRTQMEYAMMPPGSEWAWLEAYGLMEADPAVVHGEDWSASRRDVAARLEQLISREALDEEFEKGGNFVNIASGKMLEHGSGWAALERLRREAAGEPDIFPEGILFDRISLGPEQQPWLELLRTGEMPEMNPREEPSGFMVQKEWKDLLEAAIRARKGSHWLSLFHLGIMRYQAGDAVGARRAWEASLSKAVTPWAMRNLAVLAIQEGRIDEAQRLYIVACRLRPSCLALIRECGRFLVEQKRWDVFQPVLAAAPERVRKAGRIRLLEAQCALRTGDLATVESFFKDRPSVPDTREGESTIADLWLAFHAERISREKGIPVDNALCARVSRECPVPREIDFRSSKPKSEVG